MKSILTHKILITLAAILLSSSALFSQTATKVFPGADSKTPSRSEYFSWINNTNEGTTAQQTMANLDFFKWLQDQYGMVLDIYAFDAGAIDGAGYYGSINSAKFKAQFPEGFKPLAAKAATMGTRFGIWGGPDGFGNSKVEEDERVGLMTSLCRDYRFELFKFDAVCGDLRTEKQDVFIRMMTECRKNNPDLILLNHRLNLGKEGLKHATTWLLGGAETYIDVHMANDSTAPHHRAGALSRELVPELQRLTEDSGVCLSSCLDYWEDDLILQAFNRNLILAPEIYGNPWFLRDDEYPRLASIFNLARKYKEILVNGIILSEDKYGDKAVSRGDGQTRLITLRNNTWLPVTRTIKLDEEIGLSKGTVIELKQFHPVERLIGRYKKGESVTVEVLPFRSCLLIASSAKQVGPLIDGCDYEVVQNVTGKPVKINLLGFPGEKKTVRINGKSSEVVFPGKPLKEKYHRKLGDLKSVPVPADAEALYEATCFAADNNALEARSLARSGPTFISQVQKARDAFFNQQLFIDRGLWDKYLFDGDSKTAFYPGRRWGRNDIRINQGSLRIDLGRQVSLDSLRFIIGDERNLQPFTSWYDVNLEVSADLKNWTPVNMIAGKEMSVILDPAKPIRYVRLPGSPERVCEIQGYKKGKLVDRSRWRASNLFSQYGLVTPKEAFETSFVLSEIPKGSYLAIALNGKHGNEGAYAAIRVNGKPVGAPDRSLSYRSNAWEYPVQNSESNYTYYIPLTPDMVGAKIDATVLVLKNGVSEFKPEVWITAYPIPYEKISTADVGKSEWKASKEYTELNNRLRKGWNNWDAENVLSQILLPQGKCINFQIVCGKDTVANPHLGNNEIPGLVITPFGHSYDGSYSDMMIKWKGMNIRMQTAASGNDLMVLFSNDRPNDSTYLIMIPEIKYDNAGRLPDFYTTTVKGDILKLTAKLGISNQKAVTFADIEKTISLAGKKHDDLKVSYGANSKLYDAMQSVFAWNTIYDAKNDRVFTPVSRAWCQGQGFVLFEWDTYLGCYQLSMDNKDLAYANLIAITKEITSDGFVPNFTSGNHKSTDRSQPPVGSMVVNAIYKKYQDKWILNLLFDDLLTWNRWWPKNRDANGYLCWGSDPIPTTPEMGNLEKRAINQMLGAKFESGLDDSPMYDSIAYDPEHHMMKLADVGLMSLYIMDCNALAEIAQTLNRTSVAEELKGRAAKYSKSLETLWDEQAGIYLNKNLETGKLSPRMSPTNFYPLLAKVPSQQKADRMINEHFFNPKEFWGDYIMPSIARNDPAYSNEYWRGRIWGPMNFLVYLGMRNYNLPLAREAMVKKSSELLLKSFNEKRTVHENYNPDTGAGTSDDYYHWGALLGFMTFLENGTYLK
jgi:hypothetical protein